MTIPVEQSEVATFLAGLSGTQPIENHISAVYAGPVQAWKLRKAVKLSYLDFSTPALRRRMAGRERELGELAAPGLYTGTNAIIRGPDGALALAPEDAPGALDYVTSMVSVPRAAFLNDIAAQGGITPAMLDALGDAVAALHGSFVPLPQEGGADRVKRAIAENVQAGREAGLPAADVDAWRLRIEDARQAGAAVLDARAAAGLVRRAHGDLHIGNICIWRGAPAAFDMLEFDEDLATIDLGYDLAFLLMDLDLRAGRSAANRVMNRYLARTMDFGFLPVLPVFLSLRAFIRAHIHAGRGDRAESDRYMQAAARYLDRQELRAIAIGGLQGTGKSTLARALGPETGPAPGAVILRSDEIRKHQFGMAPEARLGPQAYAPAADARVTAAMVQAASECLAAGHCVIADATFRDESFRAAMQQVAERLTVPFLGLWLEVDIDILLRRVAARHGDASSAGPEILLAAVKQDPGPIEWHRIAAENFEHAASQARRAVAGMHRSAPAE